MLSFNFNVCLCNNSITKKSWVIFILSCHMSCIAQDPVVNLPQGRIVGTKVYMEKSLDPIEIFYGIPYATPPTGRFRFSAPERQTGWKNVLYAYRPPPRCPEPGNNTQSNFNEDCLFLNVWTPRITKNGKALPVIVILYSESWSQAGVSLPCQDLAAEGIVVVTVGYRLHILGFLNLGTLTARGNLALLDQYLALLWVRDNIAAFGGDPTTITLLGHSAGADSILHHIASPRSYGLFQKAIIMSPRDIWKLISEKRVVEYELLRNASLQIAFSLGCRSTDAQEVLHCLRSRPLSAYLKSNWSNILQPVPENYLPESEQYLPTSLFTALSSTKHTMQFDILLGTTDLEALNYNDSPFMEGCYMLYNIPDIYTGSELRTLPQGAAIRLYFIGKVNRNLKCSDISLGTLSTADETFKEFLEMNTSDMSDYINTVAIPNLIMLFSQHHRPELLPMLVRAVRWEYWNESPRSTDNVPDIIEYFARIESSARWSTGSALLAARLARRVPRLYVYRYSIPGAVDTNGRNINFTGAAHGSDLISLFCEALMPQIARRPASNIERRHSSVFRRYLINFVKYGYPDDERKWKAYKAGDAHIYEITDRAPNEIKENAASRDVQFWLHYLPELSNAFNSIEQSEQFATLERNGGRLRGGVFAMCGVAVVLLLLLFMSAIILHRQRSRRRFSISDDSQK